MAGAIVAPCFCNLLSPLQVVFRCCSAGDGGVGGRGDKNVTHIASMPKTQVFTVFSPTCTTHCAKDVEQGTLSQASMPLATMPKKTTVFTALLFLCVLRVADSGLIHSISETKKQV